MAEGNAPGIAQKPAAGSGLSRRGLLGGALGCGVLGGVALGAGVFATPAIARPLSASVRGWYDFKGRFVSGGRVVDTGNGDVSHSEGQGIGLLAAANANDRDGFEALFEWTQAKLLRSTDLLHSWRYNPASARPVEDLNNATDGDLLIAYGLLLAATRWDDDRYRQAGLALAHDIRRTLVVQSRYGMVLLPGADGFSHGDRLTLNPSYYIFPALQAIGRAAPSPVWDRVMQDGLTLLRAARFGRWNLPPDWLALPDGDRPRPDEQWPARFSFDAVRVPLYLCWAGLAQDPVVDAVDAFWTEPGREPVPAWTDLRTGDVAPYGQTAGMVAIRRYVAHTRAPGQTPPDIPAVTTASDYYSGALILLVNIALEMGAADLA